MAAQRLYDAQIQNHVSYNDYKVAVCTVCLRSKCVELMSERMCVCEKDW